MSEGSVAVATPGHTASLSQGPGFALYGGPDTRSQLVPRVLWRRVGDRRYFPKRGLWAGR